MNPLTKLVCSIGGANTKVLERPECVAEQNKHVAMGMMILCTGSLASLSGGYALFTVFGSTQMATAFGLFWGVFIGSLDRFFVVISPKKEGKVLTSLLSASPRILISIILGMIVSKPLEARLFQPEIEEHLAKAQLKEQKALQENTLQNSQIDELKQEKVTLEQQTNQLREQWLEAEKIANAEAEGRGGTGREGKGLVYKEKKQRADELLRQFKAKEAELTVINQRINQLGQDLAQSILEIDEKQAVSLFARLNALHELGEEKPFLGHMSLFITLLFVLIETSPILAKVMLKYSAYDKALETIENQSKFRLEKEEQDYRDKTAQDIENRQIKRQKINELGRNTFITVLKETNDSEALRKGINQAVEIIGDRVTQSAIRFAHELEIDHSQMQQKMRETQTQFMDTTVEETVKQQQTKDDFQSTSKEQVEELNKFLQDIDVDSEVPASV